MPYAYFDIPLIFEALQRYQIYGFREGAKHSYSLIGKNPWAPGENTAACVECAECLEKCPQGIAIIEQLRKAHEVLS
jgi:predicted aldo/keto reductase-like oxidoreductase